MNQSPTAAKIKYVGLDVHAETIAEGSGPILPYGNVPRILIRLTAFTNGSALTAARSATFTRLDPPDSGSRVTCATAGSIARLSRPLSFRRKPPTESKPIDATL